MTTVDNRVVDISFNNASFEAKIASTIASLDKLKAGLDFANSTHGLSDLSTAANGFNMSGMGNAIEGISGKFLAMSAVALTVISNITSKAFEAGLSLVKSLSIDPVLSGFHEMETNMNSIQTVLANTSAKGTTLTNVNDALQKLNTYSDQTIYNFSQMAKNIGTFTAAGVDLDTSVNSIKGIANLAAISGSSADQASTAMYQLSQAISTGTVKLIDWNSIVNAGMGGEIFQKALFETGKSLGTIKGTKLDTTFEQWTAAGNTFRGSLEDGWLTSQVLTNTLQGFTGDLDIAQLKALGYTETQAKEMMRLGALGKSAATEVKTLTQLLGTVKEAVGSGWTKSFQIVFGDFEEAKKLFTDLNNVIGKFVGDQADKRNELLQGWKDLGGRTTLIEGLKNAFSALSHILKPIHDAFRDFFPSMTAARLFEITKKFEEFTAKLVIGESTMGKLHIIFDAIFSVIEIGIGIVKGIIGVFGDLFSALTKNVSGSGILDFFVKIADKILNLNSILIGGGGLANFFDSVSKFIQAPLPYIKALKDAIVNFFSGDGISDGVSGSFDRVSSRFQGLLDAAGRLPGIWDWLKNALSSVADVLDPVFQLIHNWFSELGKKIADSMGPGDFNAVMDAMNITFLGGIGLLLAKFLHGGFDLDFGGGLIKGITKSFGELTGVLKAMQTDIKADALLKIAVAMGILSASLLVLSLIDSAALTKALTAMAIGFGQLVAAMALLSQVSSSVTGAAQMTILAGGMILLSTAILILATAVKILATMDWGELVKGLVAVAGLLTALALAMQLMPSGVGMVAQGAGLVAVAAAVNILAIAMKVFATMSWLEIAKGLVGVGAGLVAIAIAMNLMPNPISMVASGVALVAVGVALNLLAASMKIFATMSWKDMAKGLVGVGGGLLIIAAAMNLMPNPVSMIASSVALVAVGVALNLIAASMKIFGSMSWKEIAKGLVAMAGALLILAVATNAMTGAIGGAVAIGIVSVSLMLLVKVLKEFAKLSFADLGKGLLGMAAAIITLGLTALVLEPLIPALIGLGVALLAIGAGFALFGLGAQAVAAAFSMIAKAGRAGVDVIMFAIDQLLTRLPEIAKAFGMSLIQVATVFLNATPALIKALTAVIIQLLQTIIEAAPKLGEALLALILNGLKVIKDAFPQVVATGLAMLLALLSGVRDNIAGIVTVVAELIINFLNALTAKTPDIVAAGLAVLVAFLQGIADGSSAVVEAGINIIISLLQGVAGSIGQVVSAATDILTAFLNSIADGASRIIDAGANMIIKIVQGIGSAAGNIATAAADTIIAFLGGLEANAIRIVDAGFEFVIKLINGIADSINEHTPELREAGLNIAKAVINGLTLGIFQSKSGIGQAFIDLAKEGIANFKNTIDAHSPSRVFMRLAGFIAQGLAIGLDSDTSAVNSAARFGDRVTNSFRESLNKIPAVIDGMHEFNPVIAPVLDLTKVKSEAQNLSSILGANASMAATFSVDQARLISANTTHAQDSLAVKDAPVIPKEIKFEQNNYSPEALSTADIYRQTRNQITMAKEALAVL